MMLQLDPVSSVPLYRQIRDRLRQLIATGALPVGERLPPSRELAQRLGVHRTTIANAYAELAADGWISGHVGRGTYVAQGVERRPERKGGLAFGSRSASLENGYLWSSLLAEAPADDPLDVLLAESAAPARKVISFTTARPADELFAVEEFRRATSEVLRREGKELLQFGASDGYAPLKEYLRQQLRREGIQASDRDLLVTNGCQQALDLVRKVFLRPGDLVLMENPTYPGAIQAFHSGGVRCVGIPVDQQGLNLGALESLLTGQPARLLVVTPNFQNPTGTTLSLEARKHLLELALRHQVPVVEDNIYGALRLRGRELPPLKALDTAGLVIHLNSFSKICFPGLRVGWIVAHESVVERLRVAKQASDLHTGQLTQAAMAEFGRRGHLGRLVKKARGVYRGRLEKLEAALTAHFPGEVNWTRPEGGMSVWVALPPGIDAGVLLFKARERGVLFAPGRYFYFQAPQPNTLRLSFAGVQEKQIAKGTSVLGALLKEELRQRREGPAVRRGSRVALV